MATPLTDRPAADLLRALAADEFTAEDLTARFLDAIRRRDPLVKAFLSIDVEGALAQAREVDARRRRGEPLGPLAGVPVALKDVLCTRGWRTTCGSKILAGFVPPYD